MTDIVKQLQGITNCVPVNTNYVKIVCRKAADRIEELEANKKDILSAVARMDYQYIESVYLGYDDDGSPPE